MATNEPLKLENVYFYYTNIAQPRKKYQSQIEKEFGTTIAISKAEAKEFKKLKLNKNIKEVDTAEFEGIYKVPAPYPDQEEQYLITVTKSATYKDGNPVPEWTHPQTYLMIEGSRVRNDATLIGNGSRGDIRLELKEGINGTSVKLHSILVHDLIEVTKRGDEWADGAVNLTPKASDSAPTAVVSPTASAGDDLPF